MSEPQWTKVVIASKSRELSGVALVAFLNANGRWRFMKNAPHDRIQPRGSGCECCTGEIGEVPVRNAVGRDEVVICEAFIPPEYVGKYFKAAPEDHSGPTLPAGATMLAPGTVVLPTARCCTILFDGVAVAKALGVSAEECRKTNQSERFTFE